MSRIMPELPCDEVPAAVKHYRDVLGFSVNYTSRVRSASWTATKSACC